MQRTSYLVTLALLGAVASSRVNAAIVVGGSTLLDQTYADQLQTWLGEGDITLTRIFAKQPGDNAFDFHDAVDGTGRTFAVIEVLANSASDLVTGLADNMRQIIGGYNPQSWHVGGWNMTPDDADRTGFLFNLTSSEVQRQNLTADPGNGSYQTLNSSSHGPMFGAGYDLIVYGDLTYGYVNNSSYGGTYQVNDILIGDSRYHQGHMFGALEVFTIDAGLANSAVPEPAQIIVWIGLAAVGAFGALVRNRVRNWRIACGGLTCRA